MGWPSSNVNSGGSAGVAHVVGLLVGHHGASYVLHHLWECHGFLCLLRSYQAGESLSSKGMSGMLEREKTESVNHNV